jgi:transcriptional regulator with XRE-family HTH domain
MGETRRLVGWNIRKLRVQCDLSIEELAFKAGIAAWSIAQIERETMNSSLDTLDKIARALGVKAGDFFAPITSRPKPLRSGPGRKKKKKR